ncbi:MAG: TIGR04053 family radical SAM/SPASM domain-containing protein [Myxococcales bacterium]|nr:TIGR04053 family radical SAM/SPASM domain-containing protein [Myxococcales bacterium]
MPNRFVFDRAPARAYWETTKACDLACRHCRAEAAPHADPRELSNAQGKKLLERLAAFGDPLPHVVLTGGDPLKRDDLFELIAYAQSLGLAVSVSPSGTPLLTAEAIAQLKQAGVEAISLSLDGATPEHHDDIRQVPGCFARTLEAAKAAVDVDLMFQVNTLVAKETLADLEAIYPLVKSIGAARWSLFFLVTVGRGTVLNPISADECETLFQWLAGLPRGKGLPIVTTTEAPHYRRILLERVKARPKDAGGNGNGHGHGHPHGGEGPVPGLGIRDGNGIMFISSVGDVSPSGFLPLVAGNVKLEDPVEIYRSSQMFVALRRAESFEGRCGICEYRGPCGGSRSRALAATGSMLAEDPLCAYQPKVGAAHAHSQD